MLSSITPLGERGRGNRFGVTAAFFAVGSIAGGSALGATAGLVGRVIVPDRPSLILGALALLALAGALFDSQLGGVRLPTITRQVDERWLHRYRGWVYGVGFGAQLGAGLTTIVSSAAVYLMVLAAAGARSIVSGAVIGAAFGAVRGFSILVVRRVATAGQLRQLHRLLAANARRSVHASVAGQTVMSIAALLAVMVTG